MFHSNLLNNDLKIESNHKKNYVFDRIRKKKSYFNSGGMG